MLFIGAALFRSWLGIILLRYYRYNFPVISRMKWHNFPADFLDLWLLQCFYPHLLNCSLSLGCEGCLVGISTGAWSQPVVLCILTSCGFWWWCPSTAKIRSSNEGWEPHSSVDIGYVLRMWLGTNSVNFTSWPFTANLYPKSPFYTEQASAHGRNEQR